MSEGTTLLIELSDEPQIVHSLIESYTAILCFSKKRFFSSIDNGVSSEKNHRQHFPETVLRMSVIKTIFPRLYGRQASYNQYF
jgi:hypothetical protein